MLLTSCIIQVNKIGSIISIWENSDMLVHLSSCRIVLVERGTRIAIQQIELKKLQIFDVTLVGVDGGLLWDNFRELFL